MKIIISAVKPSDEDLDKLHHETEASLRKKAKIKKDKREVDDKDSPSLPTT
jgi:hypothetical protein